MPGRPSRSCCTPSWPPTTRRGWCWRSSASTTPHRRCSSRAPTSSAADTCPQSSTARSGCRGSPNRRRDQTWPACAPPHARTGDVFVVNGQKLWASGGIARGLVPAAGPHRSGSPQAQGHFVLPAGHDQLLASRCDPSATRSATPTSARSSSTTSEFPRPTSSARRTPDWQVAQATLGAERGMTMLELAERLGNAGFRWLVQVCRRSTIRVVADRLAQFETEITGLRGTVPAAGGERRGRHRGTGRRVDRQAVLQRTAAAA